MAFGFYGFDMTKNPLYSRLFTPEVYNNAQQAYQTGMSYFKPYDARGGQSQNQTQPTQQQTKAAPVTGQSMFVGPDGRVYQGGAKMFSDYIAEMMRTGQRPVDSGAFVQAGQLYDQNDFEGLKQYGWSALGGK